MIRRVRPKDLKTFFKKVERPLDNPVSVIYVTRVTTVNLAVFVTVPACNDPFGQATPTNFIGEKAMTNTNSEILR